ncbi:MAG: tetratricopeptide repeat protein [Acidobacteria bacterium]|nr:tetratricopeptide repeat protein [Acidobacteriota bacterium]
MRSFFSPQRRNLTWPLRRIAAADFSRGFQSTEGELLVGSSRQRRLNSGVADATRLHDAPFPALKRRAKVSRRYAAKITGIVICCVVVVMLAAHFGQAQTLPELPTITFDNFGPGIREQVKKADEEAGKNPNDAVAVGRLAMVLQTYEDLELAATVYQRARRLQPNEFQWIYLLAVCQSALGKHAEAVATFREALTKKPDYLPAQLRLADSLLTLNELAESRKLYEAIIIKEPRMAQAFYGLGRVKTKLGDKSAIEDFRKAVELSPSWGAAHYALAMAYRGAGNLDKVAEHLRLSEQNKLVRPFLADPLMNAVADLNSGAADRLRRGVELEAEGRLEESIAEHRRALEINPQYLQVHVNLIQLYGRTNQPAKAEEHYRAAMALNPTLAEAHYNFGVMLAEQKRQAEAAQAFRQAIETNPNFAEAHLNYGVILEAGQKFDEAAKHYRLAVERKPNFRQAHFQLARMLIYQKHLPEAIEHLQQTLLPPSGLEDGETPRFTYALAAAYARAGDKANGLKFARIARDKAAALKQTELLALIEKDLKVLEQER